MNQQAKPGSFSYFWVIIITLISATLFVFMWSLVISIPFYLFSNLKYKEVFIIIFYWWSVIMNPLVFIASIVHLRWRNLFRSYKNQGMNDFTAMNKACEKAKIHLPKKLLTKMIQNK